MRPGLGTGLLGVTQGITKVTQGNSTHKTRSKEDAGHNKKEEKGFPILHPEAFSPSYELPRALPAPLQQPSLFPVHAMLSSWVRVLDKVIKDCYYK